MNDKNGKNSFVLYKTHEEQFKLLALEDRGRLITAIFEYERSGTVEIEMSPVVGMAFSFIKTALDINRAEYDKKCQINAKNGAKGGRPRKQTVLSKTERFLEKPKKTDNDNDNDNDNDITPSPEGEIETETAFDRFWEAYPKKVAKKEAQKAFEKIKPGTILLDTILVAIQAQKQSGQWQDKQYIPNPATWLRREQWEDELLREREGSSFDVDDFFQAALNRTYGEGEQKADKA